jgi:hypothetical protein
MGWIDDGTQRISQGKLEDLSDGGMSVRVDDPIRRGSKRIARTSQGDFPGTVLRSRQQGQERALGIKRDTQANGEGN